MPDIGIDLALDVFQLVKILHRASVIPDRDRVPHLESDRIPEGKRCRTVARDDLSRGPGHAPSLAVVGELPDRSEREPVIDEAGMRLPCPLVEVRSPIHDAFSEK